MGETLDTMEQLWQDPEWICPLCHFTNKAIRERCRNCFFDSALVSGDRYFPLTSNSKGGTDVSTQ